MAWYSSKKGTKSYPSSYSSGWGSSIGFRSYRSGYSSWFEDSSSREKIKPILKYWAKKDLEDAFIYMLGKAVRGMQNAGRTRNITVFEKHVFDTFSLLYQTLKEKASRYKTVDFVMLYDLFKIHYYTLKELNLTETDTSYMKAILNFLDPYKDGLGFISRKKAINQSAYDYIKILMIYFRKQLQDQGMSDQELDAMQGSPEDSGKSMNLQDILENIDKFFEDPEGAPNGAFDSTDIENMSNLGESFGDVQSFSEIFDELKDAVDGNQGVVEKMQDIIKQFKDAGDLNTANNIEHYAERMQNKLDSLSKGQGAGKESDLKKTSAREIKRLRVDAKKLAGLMSNITETMEHSGHIVVKRMPMSIFDADTIDNMLEIENLSPKLKILNNFDPEVEEVFKKGTIDFYLDISGSMNQEQIDSGLSMILQLHSLGYLNNIYLFESVVLSLGKKIDLLPFVTSCGGTSFNAVAYNIKKQDKTSIVYTDGGDHLDMYDNNIYFVGCRGSNFEGINRDYVRNGRAMFYNIKNGDFQICNTSSSLSYPF